MRNALRVLAGPASDRSDLAKVDGLKTIVDRPGLHVEASQDVLDRARPDGTRVLLVGDPDGVRTSGGVLRREDVPAVLDRSSLAGCAASIEGRVLIVEVGPDSTCGITGDRFAQRDLYYQADGGTTVLATSLDLLPVATRGTRPDQMAYAHALTVYGFRPPKRHTLYEGVKRLGVGQTARLAGGAMTVDDHPFAPPAPDQYDDSRLDDYADALLAAIESRASARGNVVYLSSGWDSTAILACLVHLFGPRSVRAVTGRMLYADRSGVINQFEIDRARAFCDHYGVRLDVVDFDYRATAPAQIERVKQVLRANQVAGITALNHWILAEFAANTGDDGEVVFAGEMSDGAHNLGFSQYATYFHPNVEFREYFDKMAGYLHGPTFLRLLQDGRHDADPIYRLMRERVGTAVFDQPAETRSGRTRQILASCLLRGVRVPLWSIRNNRLLTAAGQERFASEIEEAYLGEAARSADSDTLYAWYLHVYNSLHWQGATVATIPITLEAHGRRAALPFHDARVQAFLGGMPETWGRGLDLRPTKYPLKWMLANRVPYPLQLQAGPHSYLYDIDPTFNHSAEALYGSSMRLYFAEQLRSRVYDAWLSPEAFDLDYVDVIVRRYLEGKEVRGAEMNDLWALCVLTMTGRYAGSAANSRS